MTARSLLQTVILGGALLASPFRAQAQDNFSGFNYQAVVRDAGGQPLPNQAVGVEVTITAGMSGSYMETHSVTSDDHGLISLVMGQGTPTGSSSIPTFGAIDWSAGEVMGYSVAVDITGGTSYAPLGSGTFQAVPFAMHALGSGNTGWLLNGSELSNTNAGNVGIGTTNPGTKLEVVSAGSDGVGTFRNTNAQGRSSIDFYSYYGVFPNDGIYPQLRVGYGNPGSNFMPGSAFISATDSLNIMTQGARRLTVDPYGFVGIGMLPEQFTMLSLRGGDRNFSILDGGDGDLAWDGGSNGEAQFKNTGASTGGTKFVASGGTSLMLRNNGNVGIGNDDPQARLDVAGTVKIADGTQGAGKVLTSDADGLASWQAPETKAYFSAKVPFPSNFTMTPNIEYDADFTSIRYIQNMTYSNGIITAQVGGIYHFDFAAIIPFDYPNSSEIEVRAYKNGGLYLQEPLRSLSIDVDLQAGDTFKFTVRQHTGADIELSWFSRIMGHKVN